MDASEASRKVAALTAIIQTMIQEVYCGPGGEGGREWFALQLREDEPLALAIANELGEAELAHAFTWAQRAFGSSADELSANPVVGHLSAEQRERARVALIVLDEADRAHTLAVRRVAAEAPGAEERVRMGEDAFLGRIEAEIVRERPGGPGFTATAAANATERLENLPEPWRTHARRRLRELCARIEASLEGPARERRGG